MVRALFLSAAAVLMLGAAKPTSVDYRLGVEAVAGQTPVADVEIRLRGDADGETRLQLPEALAVEPRIEGARVQTAEAGVRVLLHRPGAKLRVSYQVRSAGTDRASLAALGEGLWAIPEGRTSEPATFHWGRLPPGWRAASDLEHGALGHPMTVADVRPSVVIAGAGLQIASQTRPGGAVRAAVLGDAAAATRAAGAAAQAVGALAAFWREDSGPYLLVAGPFLGAPTDRGDGVAMAAGALSDPEITADLARTRLRAWLSKDLGPPPAGDAAPAWFTTGLSDFFARRLLLRAGLTTSQAAVADLAEADRSRDPGRRGVILALKWDEDIRRKTTGKADLDDVILRMRDHSRRFPPGQAPDVVTGLVSAAWVTAGIDLRPDIARYAGGEGRIPLPELLFDGCVDARVTVSPGFDAGFDSKASFETKVVRGVRRGGPAWNSGLRNGMVLDSWRFTAGDMSREIELVARPATKRAKPRTIRFWPYGDVDVETRVLRVSPAMSESALAACGRKIAGS